MSTLTDVLDAVVSHALASGYFATVNGHEPVNAPVGGGITAGVWVDSLAPVRSSGLAAGSGLLTLQVRLYSSVVQEPQDAIDPALLDAVNGLMVAYSGDFQLGGIAGVRCVDLLGQSGTALSMRAGYSEQQDGVYRVMTVTVPILIDDLWAQVA